MLILGWLPPVSEASPAAVALRLHYSGLSTPVRDVSGGADNVLGGRKQ